MGCFPSGCCETKPGRASWARGCPSRSHCVGFARRFLTRILAQSLCVRSVWANLGGFLQLCPETVSFIVPFSLPPGASTVDEIIVTVPSIIFPTHTANKLLSASTYYEIYCKDSRDRIGSTACAYSAEQPSNSWASAQYLRFLGPRLHRPFCDDIQ